MREKNTQQNDFRRIEETVLRRAYRLEGKVKNRGIKKVKKKEKHSK